MSNSRLSDADLYARELFPKKHGYPLWMPEPYTNVDAVRAVGVSIGDVGYVTEDGAFQFLFNVRVGADHPVNQFGVPNGFEPIDVPERDVVSSRFHMTGSVVASKFGVQKTIGGGIGTPENLPAHAEFETEWSWSSTHGAALHLPQGAHRIRCRQEVFRNYIFQHAESWYEFAAEQTHDVASDGLILITCCDKTSQWMVGAFSHESAGSSVSLYIGAMGMGEIGGSYSYLWGNAAVDPAWRQWPEVGRSTLPTLPSAASTSSTTSIMGRANVLNDCSPDGQTHCVFFKGYRIAIRERALIKDKRITVSKLETQPPEWRKRGENQSFAQPKSFGSRVGSLFGSVWSKNKNKPKSEAVDPEPLRSTFPTAFSNPRPRPRLPKPALPLPEWSPPPPRAKVEKVITAEPFPYHEAPAQCSPHSLAIRLLIERNPTASVALVHDDDWLPFCDDLSSYPILLKAVAPMFSRISGKTAYFDSAIQNYDTRRAFPPRAVWLVVVAKVKFLRLLPVRPSASRAQFASAPRQIVEPNQHLGPSRRTFRPDMTTGSGYIYERDTYGARAVPKPTPCLFWAKGQCKYGDECRYSHEMSSPPRSTGSGEYKTRICWNWEQTGACRFGNKCSFAHGPAELRQTRDSDSQLCWDYAERGYCPRGDTCRFIHEPPLRLSHQLHLEEGTTTASSDVPFSHFTSDVETQSTLPTDDDRDSEPERSIDIPQEGVGLHAKPSTHTLRAQTSKTSLRTKRSSQGIRAGPRRRQSFSEDSEDEEYGGEPSLWVSQRKASPGSSPHNTSSRPSGSPAQGSMSQFRPPVSFHNRRTSSASQKKLLENSRSTFDKLSDVDI